MDEKLSQCLANCPIEGTLRIIGGKWTGSLLWFLMQQPQRFGDIQRHIPEASPKILTQRLRTLEDANIIERVVLATKPFAVEYRLTEHGESLAPLVNALSNWGQLHYQYIYQQSLNTTMQFSNYIPQQKSAIQQLFTQTFQDSEGATEGQLIGQLIHDLIQTTDPQDLHVFVATKQGAIVGSILFSRLSFENQIPAFLMAPVAVKTEYHGQGIGQALIRFGLQALREQGVALVMTYGDPNFYSKIGFQAVSATHIPAPLPLSQPEGWLGLSLTGNAITPIAGRSSCVAAFNSPHLW